MENNEIPKYDSAIHDSLELSEHCEIAQEGLSDLIEDLGTPSNLDPIINIRLAKLATEFNESVVSQTALAVATYLSELLADSNFTGSTDGIVVRSAEQQMNSLYSLAAKLPESKSDEA